MKQEHIAIVLTSYNNKKILPLTLGSIQQQSWPHFSVFVIDDGSSDGTLELLNSLDDERFHVEGLSHGERGRARVRGAQKALMSGAHYIYFIDSDMELDHALFENCLRYMQGHPETAALVIPEHAYSLSKNFATSVKVFERNVMNNAGKNLGLFSIEAARFWRREAFELSGGFHEDELAFEEIQPTLRYLELQEGLIQRATFTFVRHNEKKVSWKNLFEKKASYFQYMQTPARIEKHGWWKILSRWYFFRPVLYRPSNLWRYICHPLLTLGMILMYIVLSFLGVYQLFFHRSSLTKAHN